jgi:SH3-like domain-containing protein
MIRSIILIFFLMSPLAFAFDKGSESGLPIPRWVSLKGDANLRYGPTTDANIIYRYQHKGYPMEILRETDGWRYVKDPQDGVEGWMRSFLFSGKRYAITKTEPFSYGYDNTKKNQILVKLNRGVHTSIKHCDSKWCLLEMTLEEDELDFWVEKKNLFGVYSNEIIK